MANRRFTPVRRVETIANPAAGAEVSIRPTTGGLWLVRSFVAILTTSAVVATRAPVLTVDNGTTTYWRSPASSTIAASIVAELSAFDGTSLLDGVGDARLFAWPSLGLILPQGHTLRTATGAIDPGDQYSAVAVLIDDFPAGPEFALRPFVTADIRESEWAHE